MNLYALVLAGGEGKRFWPLSRKDRPKQFLSLLGGKSMIRNTIDRILPLVPVENVFVVTLEKYAEETLEHIPELPKENIIAEPQGKNTAPAVVIGSLRVNKMNPDAVTVVLPADHAIGEEDVFRDVLRFGAQVVNTKLPNGEYPLVTLGVRPERPETGYGYIKEAEVVKTLKKYSAKKVDRFTEKPDLQTASRFLETGGYYWNSGIFIWRVSSILGAFQKLLPEWHKHFGKVHEFLNTPGEKAGLLEFYEQIDSGPIDKFILEKWENTLVIPIDFPWSDVGSWGALDEFLRTDNKENILHGEAVCVDSSSCLVFSDKKLIAMVGVNDLVVVETDGAILVLKKDKAQDVKKVVEMLEKKKGKYT